MHLIRVKNNAKRGSFIRRLDIKVETKEGADVIFHSIIEAFDGLNATVCMYDNISRELIKEQHCQYLG